MKEIYTPDNARALARAGKIWRWVSLGIFLAGLIACTLLCVRVTTENAGRRQLETVIIAILSGWVAISLWVLIVQPLRARAGHVRGILEGEETERTGVLISVGQKLFLPRSVTIRRVRVRVGKEEETLNILAELAEELPAPGTSLVLKTVRGYITGTGESHE